MKNVINYQTKGTCCKQIIVEVEDEIIKNIEFLGGCQGNLKGIKALVIGANINEISQKLRGISCGDKQTSCPDQLALCLQEYIKTQAATV